MEDKSINPPTSFNSPLARLPGNIKTTMLTPWATVPPRDSAVTRRDPANSAHASSLPLPVRWPKPMGRNWEPSNLRSSSPEEGEQQPSVSGASGTPWGHIPHAAAAEAVLGRSDGSVSFPLPTTGCAFSYLFPALSCGVWLQKHLEVCVKVLLLHF